MKWVEYFNSKQHILYNDYDVPVADITLGRMRENSYYARVYGAAKPASEYFKLDELEEAKAWVLVTYKLLKS